MRLLLRLAIGIVVTIGLLVMHGVAPVHASECSHEHAEHHHIEAISGEHVHADAQELATARPTTDCADDHGMHGCAGMVRKASHDEPMVATSAAFLDCSAPAVVSAAPSSATSIGFRKPDLNLLGISRT